MKETQKRDFDSAAAAWDENPGRVKLAREVASAIQQQVALGPTMQVADFGCGTGLLSFLLLPLVGSLTGIDSSPGMLEVFRHKIDRLQATNVRTQLVDFDRGESLTGSFDLVVSNMTLHHVKETAPLLEQFHAVLVPGGSFAIADLDPDGGLFHEDNTGVYHEGFNRQALETALAAAGFVDIRDTTASRMDKPLKGGGSKSFSIFLLTGRKPR